jgi:demethylmenaquinone methyltransferase/2-methoxy-6-polyprenyl-1,4-benzoquinol methylase
MSTYFNKKTAVVFIVTILCILLLWLRGLGFGHETRLSKFLGITFFGSDVYLGTWFIFMMIVPIGFGIPYLVIRFIFHEQIQDYGFSLGEFKSGALWILALLPAYVFLPLGSAQVGTEKYYTILGRERAIRKKCVHQLHLRKGDRVLDLACGTGKNHPHLIDAVGDEGAVVGFDFTAEMLARAKAQAETRGWKNVRFIQGDAATIELPAESFDGVIGVLGFSVIPDHEEAIRRAVALLKASGRIVICDAVPFQGIWQVFNLIVEPIYRRFACWDIRKDIIGVMKKYVAGLDIQWLNGGSIFIAAGRR